MWDDERLLHAKDLGELWSRELLNKVSTVITYVCWGWSDRLEVGRHFEVLVVKLDGRQVSI